MAHVGVDKFLQVRYAQTPASVEPVGGTLDGDYLLI